MYIFVFIFFYRTFSLRLPEFILGVLFVISSGIWFYIYGKAAYDFPFSMLTFSIVLIILTRLFISVQVLWLYFLTFFLGFYLSWKLYNMFLLVGTIGILLIHKSTRNIIWSNIKNFKLIFLCLLLFVLGYVLGNFHLIDNFPGTIKEIRAYKASANFPYFLFKGRAVIWDHVNIMSYNATNFRVIIAIFVLFVLPLFLRKYLYILVSIFLVLNFYIFIRYFSPGYSWHGFSLSAYIILLFLVLLGYFKYLNLYYRVILLVICYSLVLGQAGYNFIKYVPEQVKWFYTTNSIAENMRINTNVIMSIIDKEVHKRAIGKEDYKVYRNLQRYYLESNNHLNFVLPMNNLIKFTVNIQPKYIFSIYDIRQKNVLSLNNIYNKFNNSAKDQLYKKENIYKSGYIRIDLYIRTEKLQLSSTDAS